MLYTLAGFRGVSPRQPPGGAADLTLEKPDRLAVPGGGFTGWFFTAPDHSIPAVKTIASLFLAALLFPSAAGAQLVETNVALGKPTTGDVAFGYPTSNGNDGNVGTFTHADNLNAPPGNPFWSVDLQGTFDLMRVEIVDRIGCCDPNRFNGSEIRILDSLGTQIGATLTVNDLLPSSPDEAGATRTFDNGGAGWPGAASVRIDGYTQYFQFAEFRAIALQPPTAVNVAVYGAATASAPTWPGLGPQNLIDGNALTVTHPQGAAGETLGFTYTVNLGTLYHFERLEILNRTACCPERLTNYRVRLHHDAGGAPGPAVWSADVRTDGSNSGDGGVDTLVAGDDPAGTFAGQFITVENLSSEAYNPQIAELRAFSFDPRPVNLATGKPVELFDATGTPAATWNGFPASFLVDGILGTFSHPQPQFSSGYYYRIDLGAETPVGEVRVSGRLDGCCPERLNNARLEIRDGNFNTVWQHILTGQVTAQTAVATGDVTGRYVIIVNTDGADYGPQVSEVVVLPPLPQEVFQITAANFNIPAGTGTLTFTSRPGFAYFLEGGPNLIDWTLLLGGIEATGNTTTVNFIDPGMPGSPNRYYRVQKLP